MMKKTALMMRCVPRYGYANTEVRMVDLDVTNEYDERELLQVLHAFFATRGIGDAVYDIEVDDDGFFAVINDEAYDHEWGTALL